VEQYGDIYRYCYVRGPDGIIIGLVEELRRTKLRNPTQRL
jgi:hypothetical protein